MNQISVDRTTRMLVDALRTDLAAEPPAPDPDVTDGHALAEAATMHYEWQRKVNAWRLLIGVRLTSAALDQLDAP